MRGDADGRREPGHAGHVHEHAALADGKSTRPCRARPRRPDATRRADLTRFLGELNTFRATPRPASSAPAMAGGSPAAWTPVEIAMTRVTLQCEGPRSAYDFTFPQGVLWGMIG